MTFIFNTSIYYTVGGENNGPIFIEITDKALTLLSEMLKRVISLVLVEPEHESELLMLLVSPLHVKFPPKGIRFVLEMSLSHFDDEGNYTTKFDPLLIRFTDENVKIRLPVVFTIFGSNVALKLLNSVGFKVTEAIVEFCDLSVPI